MAENKRDELVNNICMFLASCGVDTSDAKNQLYVLTEPYEILSRSTAVAEVKEDRNRQLLGRFLVAKTVKGCTEKTVRAYKNGIQNTLVRIGKTVDDITADDIRYYLAVRQTRDHITKCTADNELRYLRTFFQFLENEELIGKDPTRKVDRIKNNRPKKSAFTDIEVERIRMAAQGERESAVVETLLSTGCRVSELVGIRLDEIKDEKVLIHGKGEKDRYCYLNAKALVAIEAYLTCRKDDNPFLFAGVRKDLTIKGLRSERKNWWMNSALTSPDGHIDKGTVEQMMRRIAKRAGVEQANPHKFRRTCATMALRRGMPLEQVSKMLGHEQIGTTQIYLDLTEDELEQAHKKYVI